MEKQNVFTKNLVLTAKLTSALSSIVSVIYLVLSTIGLLYYFKCLENGVTLDIWNTARYMYMQDPETCEESSTYMDSNLVQPHTILSFMAITLSVSAVNLVTSMFLFRQISHGTTNYAVVYIYAYVGSWFATLIVDLTLGTLLGLDITYLGQLMEEHNNGDLRVFLMQQSAIYTMTIALKGYVIHAIKFALIVILVIYLIEHRRKDVEEFQNSTNSTYTVQTAIQAFEDNNNSVMEHKTSFNGNKPPTAVVLTEHRQPHANANRVGIHILPRQRPFSYFEEPRMPEPKQGVASGWRAILAPPVPYRDYTPPSQRRLKPALKSTTY